MMQRRHLALVAAALVLLLAGSALAQTLWVRSRYARLRAGTTSKDAVVAKLHHGEAVKVLKTQGGFARVRIAGGIEGWVSSTWLSAKAPSKRNRRLETLGAAARNDGSKISYTAGARGLAPEAKTYATAKGNAAAAARALEQLEKVVISDDALDAFLSAGKLGDYKVAP